MSETTTPAVRSNGPKTRGSGLLIALIVLSFAAGLAANWGYTTYAISQARSQSQQLQRSQEAQGAQVEARLCTTLGRLAAIVPPRQTFLFDIPADENRKFIVQEHDVLAQLFPDVQCPAKYLSR